VGDSLEQLTYLIFLKMADECSAVGDRIYSAMSLKTCPECGELQQRNQWRLCACGHVFDPPKTVPDTRESPNPRPSAGALPVGIVLGGSLLAHLLVSACSSNFLAALLLAGLVAVVTFLSLLLTVPRIYVICGILDFLGLLILITLLTWLTFLAGSVLGAGFRDSPL
jgi:hypothetical protein